MIKTLSKTLKEKRTYGIALLIALMMITSVIITTQSVKAKTELPEWQKLASTSVVQNGSYDFYVWKNDDDYITKRINLTGGNTTVAQPNTYSVLQTGGGTNLTLPATITTKTAGMTIPEGYIDAGQTTRSYNTYSNIIAKVGIVIPRGWKYKETTRKTVTNPNHFYPAENMLTPSNKDLVKEGYLVTTTHNAGIEPYTDDNQNTNRYNYGGIGINLIPNKTTVNYKGNTSTSGTMQSQTVTYDSTTNLKKNQYAKTGYNFNGWKDDNNKTYADEGTVTTAWPDTTTVNLHAQWEPIKYTLKFDTNNVTPKNVDFSDRQNIPYDEFFDIPNTQMKVNGYRFLGWNTKKDGSGEKIDATQPVGNLTTKDGDTVTIYAQWENLLPQMKQAELAWLENVNPWDYPECSRDKLEDFINEASTKVNNAKNADELDKIKKDTRNYLNLLSKEYENYVYVKFVNENGTPLNATGEVKSNWTNDKRTCITTTYDSDLKITGQRETIEPTIANETGLVYKTDERYEAKSTHSVKRIDNGYETKSEITNNGVQTIRNYRTPEGYKPLTGEITFKLDPENERVSLVNDETNRAYIVTNTIYIVYEKYDNAEPSFAPALKDAYKRIDNIDINDYSEPEVTTLKQAINEVNDALSTALTTSDVMQAMEKFENDIKDLQTTKEKMAPIIAKAKEDAVKEINDKYNENNYSEKELETISKMAADAVKNINEAETLEDIENILNDFKNAAKDIKTNEQKAKEKEAAEKAAREKAEREKAEAERKAAEAKAAADKKAAEDVIAQINAIPAKITTENEQLITNTRNAYESLTDEQKALIPTDILDKLIKAEKDLTTLKEFHDGTTAKIKGLTFKVKSAAKKTAYLVKGNKKAKVTIPAKVKIKGFKCKVTGIKAKAFTKSKTKTLIVKTKYLTKKAVKNSLKNSKIKKIKIKIGNKKVNEKYIKKYKKIFTKKNAGKKVKIQ